MWCRPRGQPEKQAPLLHTCPFFFDVAWKLLFLIDHTERPPAFSAVPSSKYHVDVFVRCVLYV